MADSAGSGDWTELGLFTVAPGVHRIPLPLPNDGLRAVNVYAIESGDDLVLDGKLHKHWGFGGGPHRWWHVHSVHPRTFPGSAPGDRLL